MGKASPKELMTFIPESLLSGLFAQVKPRIPKTSPQSLSRYLSSQETHGVRATRQSQRHSLWVGDRAAGRDEMKWWRRKKSQRRATLRYVILPYLL